MTSSGAAPLALIPAKDRDAGFGICLAMRSLSLKCLGCSAAFPRLCAQEALGAFGNFVNGTGLLLVTQIVSSARTPKLFW